MSIARAFERTARNTQHRISQDVIDTTDARLRCRASGSLNECPLDGFWGTRIANGVV